MKESARNWIVLVTAYVIILGSTITGLFGKVVFFERVSVFATVALFIGMVLSYIMMGTKDVKEKSLASLRELSRNEVEIRAGVRPRPTGRMALRIWSNVFFLFMVIVMIGYDHVVVGVLTCISWLIFLTVIRGATEDAKKILKEVTNDRS